MAGLPALQGSKPGQVRKEAATAIYCECRGSGSPPNLFTNSYSLPIIVKSRSLKRVPYSSPRAQMAP